MATNPIVEAEEDFDNIDNVEDLTQRLGQELKSEEEQVEEQPTENVETEELPPKFQGKSVDDIINSYVNLEQQYGRQGNELGELRKLTDSLIQKIYKKMPLVNVQSLLRNLFLKMTFITTRLMRYAK